MVEPAAVSPSPGIPWIYHLLLWNPRQVRQNLDRFFAAGLSEQRLSLWQAFMGVLYMMHRLLYRPETVGVSDTDRVRATRRARLLQFRPLRSFFLLKERAITPFDLSGFGCSPEQVVRHLLATYHPGDNFIYDLQFLSCYPDHLEEVARRARQVVEIDSSRHRFLRDLAVYENYHERLLVAAERAVKGDFGLRPEDQQNADTTVVAYVRWCGRQPATAGEAWRAWRRGEIDFSPRV